MLFYNFWITIKFVTFLFTRCQNDKIVFFFYSLLCIRVELPQIKITAMSDFLIIIKYLHVNDLFNTDLNNLHAYKFLRIIIWNVPVTSMSG